MRDSSEGGEGEGEGERTEAEPRKRRRDGELAVSKAPRLGHPRRGNLEAARVDGWAEAGQLGGAAKGSDQGLERQR